MMKQRLRKIKSIVENHIDPEQEKIRGIKTEIDGKLQKILGYLEEVDGNDDKKESIEGLIEGFRNHCKSLYAGYDNLTRELKEEFHGSSSSSSDSSDNDSPKKNGKRNGKIGNKIGENGVVVVVEEDPEKGLSEKDLELIQLRDENLRLQIRSSEMEKALIGKEDEISNLKKKCDKIEENERRMRNAEEEIEQVQDQMRKVVDSKNQDINQLEDAIEDLKIDLEIKEDEINTLMENMRTTEVKQRLTSQKLRITEQVLADKEENHRKRVEVLLEEKRVLEDVNASMATCIEAQVKLASEVCEKVNETVMGIDTLSVKFEEDFGHLESRIYEITNELKVVMNWISVNKTEQDRMKEEIGRLVEELKEEKEERFVLTAKMEVLQASLQNGDDERTRLNQTVKRGEEKMGELERMIGERDEQMRELERKIGEKDSEFLSVIEEKKDAIKQLCIRIDYCQCRYKDLRDMVLKARGVRMKKGT